jgi:phosphohistidine phosphatase SixA
MTRAATLVLLAVLLAGCGGSAAPDAEEARLGPLELVETLREGGYVVYLRHAATDRSREDDPAVDLDDCATQRNLSDAGREQARTIGAAFRALEIPLGRVAASEYCRTRETAELAFGAFEDEPDLTGFPEESDPTYDERVRRTNELLATLPADGQNTILVAHIKNLEESVSRSIDEGELAVFEPLGGMRSRYRGQIPASLWPDLVEQAGR